MSTDWGKFIPMKIGKILGVIILLLLIASICIGLLTNKHIKLWVLEFNAPINTSEKELPTQPTTILIAKDSPITSKPINKLITETKTKPNTVDRTQSQSKTNQQIGKNIVGGDNHGIVGDNNIVNAPIQPYPSKDIIDKIISETRGFSTPIRFMYSSNSKMSEVYITELIKILNNKGFTDVYTIVDLANSIKVEKGVHKMEPDDPNPRTPEKEFSLQYFINADN